MSDGFFKDRFGTAAYGIETNSSDGRMIGKVIAPGNESDQSAFKSELSGIFSMLVLIKHLS